MTSFIIDMRQRVMGNCVECSFSLMQLFHYPLYRPTLEADDLTFPLSLLGLFCWRFCDVRSGFDYEIVVFCFQDIY